MREKKGTRESKRGLRVEEGWGSQREWEERSKEWKMDEGVKESEKKVGQEKKGLRVRERN